MSSDGEVLYHNWILKPAQMVVYSSWKTGKGICAKKYQGCKADKDDQEAFLYKTTDFEGELIDQME